MLGSDLIVWRQSLRLGQAAASRAIGCSRSSVKNWERDPDATVPRYIALACAGISSALARADSSAPEHARLAELVTAGMKHR